MLGVFVALAACSNGGEGERCQAENGNDDCQSGLVCLAATQKAFNGGKGLVNPPFNNSDRCCPLDRASTTNPACTVPGSSVTGDAAPPGDTGPAADATADAADSSTARDADASSDADAD